MYLDKNSQESSKEEYPPPKVVIPAMIAICLAVFLVALDRTILGTATPSITQEFHSFEDISWYEAGFLLPLCALQLTFGRVYTFYSTKWVLIILVAIFETGSIVCALAPTSNALIVGRAVSGIGAAGTTSGAFIIINNLVPLELRPKYTGAFGAVFGLSSILGPILGGYLTAVSWRWCFWINVPIGVIALVVLVLLTPKTPPPLPPAPTWMGKLNQMDPLGFLLIAPATICLLFAVQWGGVKYPWNDPHIIALFCVSAVLALAFIAVQTWRKENATVPGRIFLQRNVLAACILAFGLGSLLVVYGYYLPLWFQAIQDKSPQSSGLSLLGLLLSNVFFVITTGILTSKIGYYTPFAIAGSAILIVGAGLVTTWEPSASPGQWIGYEVIVGVGLGMILQQPNVAVQSTLSKEDAPVGLSLLAFVQFLGGTICVSVGQTLLVNKFVQGLSGVDVGFDPQEIASQGATTIRTLVPDNKLPLFLQVYNDSLRSIWYEGLALACIAFLAALALEWKNIKEQPVVDPEKGKEIN